jgi:hypothetical protein
MQGMVAQFRPVMEALDLDRVLHVGAGAGPGDAAIAPEVMKLARNNHLRRNRTIGGLRCSRKPQEWTAGANGAM